MGQQASKRKRECSLKKNERLFFSYLETVFYVHTSRSDRWFVPLDGRILVFSIPFLCYWAKMWGLKIRATAPQHENCHNFCSKPVSHQVKQVCNNQRVQKPVSATFMDGWMDSLFFFSELDRYKLRIVRKGLWNKIHSYLLFLFFYSVVEIGFHARLNKWL